MARSAYAAHGAAAVGPSVLKLQVGEEEFDSDSNATGPDFWRDAQGANHTWYCGSTYLKCMLHENAITSALDAVCLLTGAQAKLEARGFRVSDDTLELHRGD